MSAFRSLYSSLRLAPTANTAARGFSTSASRNAARMILTGRLGAEPELHATSTGQEIIRYTIGTTTGRGENKSTSWFKVASFADGSQRDFLLSLPKGTLVYVEGDASMRTWENAEGQKQSTLNLVQRNLEILSRPQNSNAEQQ
ncbi:hypothetical protein N7468_007980 [Penicillium chermesinum]|uniref:SsDNA binding protein n=1 Tax=Penicillium chermesinum TaxID=63820 RepID=A0A9W9NPA9_9EURO|nr:uncharacterized protein N7468_007980 [Penicillium chermesinum]KAJ5223438.1 hypothetical protein N7468_007980 [Penicillium chermesinum]KAJ6155727.1 hypothetical protein N7470_006293 [Penicillium chermesinum]